MNGNSNSKFYVSVSETTDQKYIRISVKIDKWPELVDYIQPNIDAFAFSLENIAKLIRIGPPAELQKES